MLSFNIHHKLKPPTEKHFSANSKCSKVSRSSLDVCKVSPRPDIGCSWLSVVHVICMHANSAQSVSLPGWMQREGEPQLRSWVCEIKEMLKGFVCPFHLLRWCYDASYVNCTNAAFFHTLLDPCTILLSIPPRVVVFFDIFTFLFHTLFSLWLCARQC